MPRTSSSSVVITASGATRCGFRRGDFRWLLTLEQRFFSQLHLFRVVRVGAAAFFDVGSAHFTGESDREILKDVGVGLRLSSSRSGNANVIHLDLAFPLDRRSGIESVQWLISTKETF